MERRIEICVNGKWKNTPMKCLKIGDVIRAFDCDNAGRRTYVCDNAVVASQPYIDDNNVLAIEISSKL